MAGTSESDSSAEEDAAERMQVQSLVEGRSKRMTAGNRMSAMLEEIGTDDELELLFAEDNEDGPDEEFDDEADDAGSDIDMGDSSDEEDHEAAAGDKGLSGEKELENEIRAEKKRQRKAQRALTQPAKRPKYGPSSGAMAPSLSAAHPRKRIERLSWLPTTNEATRSSKRGATTQQSNALRTRIKARERDREQQLKKQEEVARRREANKPQTLSQRDRLEEAAREEKRNLKKLNRWEASERDRKRVEEEKLEALRNRQLTVPAVSFFSRQAWWAGDRLVAVGHQQPESIEVKVSAESKVEQSKDQGQLSRDKSSDVDGRGVSVVDSSVQRSVSTEAIVRPRSSGSGTPPSSRTAASHSTRPTVHVPTSRDSLVQLLSAPGISQSSTIQVSPDRAIKEEPDVTSLPSRTTNAGPSGPQQIVFAVRAPPAPALPSTPAPAQLHPASQDPDGTFSQATKPELALRNYVVLQNVDPKGPPSDIPDELQGSILLAKPVKKARSNKSASALCPVTGLPIRYKDPRTGVGYANSYAYRQLQKIVDGRLRWSKVASCYLGLSGPAAGVPETFRQNAVR